MNPNRFLARGAVRWALLVLIVWVAAGLRFYQLGRESLWDGEIFTLLFAQYDWAKLVPSVAMFSAHPPLWFALSKASTVFGWNEMILRMPAALAGTLSVPALYVLGKRLFDARVALGGAVLLAISPLDVLFSQNARNYAFFVLLTILVVYGAYRAVETTARDQTPNASGGRDATAQSSWGRGFWGERDRARWWLLFGVAALAGLYTHYLFILPLAGTILAAALKLLNDAARQGGGWRAWRGWWGPALVAARPFLIALIAVALFYLPWVPTVGYAFVGRQLSRETLMEGDENAALSVQDVPRLLKDFSGAATWGLVLVCALAAVGAGWAWWTGRRDPKPRAALFWFGVALVLPVLVMVLLAPRRLPSKYLIFVLPAFLLLVSNGVIGLAAGSSRRLNLPRVAYALGGGLFVALAAATLPNLPYWNGTHTIFTGRGWTIVDEWAPWREVAASVTSRASPGDFVLFPDEARALTARSVVPYFDDAFYQRLYSAPPQGRIWWVSESKDAPTASAALVREEKTFGRLVVQEMARPARFAQVPFVNASFEDGFKGWDKPGDSALWSRDEADKVDGAASARVTLKRADFPTLRSTPFPVTTGKLYRVSAYVKNPTIGFYTTSPQMMVNFYNDRGGPPKRTRLATLLPSDHPGWTLMVNEGIVPPGAKTARLEFMYRDYAYTLGRTSWLDNIQVWLEQ
jgi:4-amino-4-deoxy-L-arabinose transferase-like glycosyltransferase